MAKQAAVLRARYNLTLTDTRQVAAKAAATCDALPHQRISTLQRVTELQGIVVEQLES